MHNFEQMIDRKNTASVKWDALKASFGKEDLLPMWVADMDFKPPEMVLEVMKKRVEHGVFGYTITTEQTTKAIRHWLSKRHNWDIDPTWIMYSPGVVPSLGMAIHAFTEPGDKVLLQSPVYTPFFNMIESNDREVVNSQLQINNGKYEIDFVDFEEKIKSGVKLFLLCSPHNPTGRVWSKEELEKMAHICQKYDVIIASDEIHSDIVKAPHKHHPIGSLNESIADMTLTLMAPSKTFNLAGLQASFMVVSNDDMRKKIASIQRKQGFFSLNTFGILAMEAAYMYGEQWLEDALIYIRGNVELIQSEIKQSMPNLHVIETEGTYLVWIDCRKLGLNDQEIRKRLLDHGLAINFGHTYGPGGEGFIRINVACHRSIVEEGIKRLKLAFM